MGIAANNLLIVACFLDRVGKLYELTIRSDDSSEKETFERLCKRKTMMLNHKFEF